MIVMDPMKQELFDNIKNTMDQYCSGCFLHLYFKNEHGKRAAHRFCISKCTIGEQLKKFGEKLS